MKAITLHQPWASLIAIGAKTIETRPSPPNGPMCPAGVRGYPGLKVERGERIAIHAAARRPDVEHDGLGRIGDWWVEDSRLGYFTMHAAADGWGDDPDAAEDIPLPLGAVVATAVITDVAPMVDDRGWTFDADTPEGPWIDLWNDEIARTHQPDDVTPIDDQLPLGHFAHGRWGWLLDDVETFDPILCKGRQGVWQPEYDASVAIHVAQLLPRYLDRGRA